MGVYRFEDLRVWQAAQKQSDDVGALRIRPEFQSDRELTSEMNDAAISVASNISEGFLRRKDKETAQFLRYSFASNGEVRSCFYAAHGRHYIQGPELARLLENNSAIAKMLRRWQSRLDKD